MANSGGSEIGLPAVTKPTSVSLVPGVSVRPAADQLPGWLSFLSPGSWFDVVSKGGAMSLALNESAAPRLGTGEDPAIVVDGPKVRLSVANAKPGLSYALSSVTDLTCPFKEPADGWLRYEGPTEGSVILAAEMSATSGFFKVFVSDR